MPRAFRTNRPVPRMRTTLRMPAVVRACRFLGVARAGSTEVVMFGAFRRCRIGDMCGHRWAARLFRTLGDMLTDLLTERQPVRGGPVSTPRRCRRRVPAERRE